MPSKREQKAAGQPVQEPPHDVQQPVQEAPQETAEGAVWSVTASKLNGRQEPSLDAQVGTVRPKGDTVTGQLDGDWVTGDDGLHYKAEFLEQQLEE